MKYFLERKPTIFLNLKDILIYQKFITSFKLFFSKNDNFDLRVIENNFSDSFYNNANEIVQFGWKKLCLLP